MTYDRIDMSRFNQILQASAPPNQADWPTRSNRSHEMHRSRRSAKFICQAAFEAKREFRLHRGAELALGGQHGQQPFDASVKIARCHVQYAHQLVTVPASR